MSLTPLSLSVNPGSWRLFATRKSDPGFKRFSEKIWQRDGYTCQFCGFQAREYMEVINLDANYRNNSASNMVTSCCFCAQCNFLEAVGQSDYGGGTLVYLPELTQTELNGLCHVLFCAMANATSYRADAQTIYQNLKMRASIVDEKLGEGLSEPAQLGTLMVEAPQEQVAKVKDHILSNLKLLPSRAKFNRQIEAWAKAALEEMNT